MMAATDQQRIKIKNAIEAKRDYLKKLNTSIIEEVISRLNVNLESLDFAKITDDKELDKQIDASFDKGIVDIYKLAGSSNPASPELISLLNARFYEQQTLLLPSINIQYKDGDITHFAPKLEINSTNSNDPSSNLGVMTGKTTVTLYANKLKAASTAEKDAFYEAVFLKAMYGERFGYSAKGEIVLQKATLNVASFPTDIILRDEAIAQLARFKAKYPEINITLPKDCEDAFNKELKKLADEASADKVASTDTLEFTKKSATPTPRAEKEANVGLPKTVMTELKDVLERRKNKSEATATMPNSDTLPPPAYDQGLSIPPPLPPSYIGGADGMPPPPPLPNSYVGGTDEMPPPPPLPVEPSTVTVSSTSTPSTPKVTTASTTPEAATTTPPAPTTPKAATTTPPASPTTSTGEKKFNKSSGEKKISPSQQKHQKELEAENHRIAVANELEQIRKGMKDSRDKRTQVAESKGSSSPSGAPAALFNIQANPSHQLTPPSEQKEEARILKQMTKVSTISPFREQHANSSSTEPSPKVIDLQFKPGTEPGLTR